MEAFRAALTAGTPVALAVVLALATASVTRPGPHTAALVPEEVAALEGRGLEIGPPDRPLRVRVVSDYECAACESLERAAGDVLRGWARSGRMAYQFVQAPLPGHRRAPRAAAALLCAHAQGRPWDMHARLVDGAGEWAAGPDPRPRLERYAREEGLDPTLFARCLGAEATGERLAADAAVLDALGRPGVPVIIVNDTLVRPRRTFREVLRYVRRRLPAQSAAFGASRHPTARTSPRR